MTSCVKASCIILLPTTNALRVVISPLTEDYASLIDKISVRGTWDRNPLLVVYSFELEE